MDWGPDRKLDAVGVGLALVVLASAGLLVAVAVEGPDDSVQVPDVEWSIERVNDSHVEVRHDGGPAVQAEGLLFRNNNRAMPTPFEGVVRPDDAATFRVSPGRTIRIEWVEEDAATGTRMAEATV